MKNVLTGYSTRNTPQDRKVDKRQVENSAGGYTFTITPADRLRRFLILGTDNGSYYASAATLTAENADLIVEMAQESDETHGILVKTIVDVSTKGAAPKNDQALFALAIAASFGSVESRQIALAVLPSVARTGTHLFQFAEYVQQFRGWGRSLRRAIADWYTTKHHDRTAYQVTKYRQRNGWSHRDLLRLAHPYTENREMAAIFDWVTHGNVSEALPGLIQGHLAAQQDGADFPELIRQHGLTWEMLPDSALARRETWYELTYDMPLGAMIRQLPRLSRLDLLNPLLGSSVVDHVVGSIDNADYLKAARIHPLNLLIAERTYSSGQSLHGSSTWSPEPTVSKALDSAFYKAFDAFEPAGKRTMIALDVSGSMSQQIAGQPISAREAAAALALVQLDTEPRSSIYGFTGQDDGSYFRLHKPAAISKLKISPAMRLGDVLHYTDSLPFGPTDCALPMQHALRHNLEVDTFIVYTDSETWAGGTHPHQALQEYRRKMGIDAKLVVVGMTSNGFSIANPDDPGMMDVVGFDPATPSLINEFSRGF